MGFGWSVLLWGGIIALIYLLYRFARAPAVLSFWCAYVLTRPLGASIGDLLSADKSEGGLGAGTLVTSLLFLGLILITAGAVQLAQVLLPDEALHVELVVVQHRKARRAVPAASVCTGGHCPVKQHFVFC